MNILRVFKTLGSMLAFTAPSRSETVCSDDDFHEFIKEFHESLSEQQRLSAKLIISSQFQEIWCAMPAWHPETKTKEELDWSIAPAFDRHSLSFYAFKGWIKCQDDGERETSFIGISKQSLLDLRLCFGWHLHPSRLDRIA